MKKLKKVLSLVLVLAMALSMFGASAFAAGTTDYTDDADLTYGSKAVAVMSDLGVINGFDDGSFRPSSDYTRAQAAKVITYMLATPAIAEKLNAPAKDVFADVKTDHWAAADVAYAVDKKIIAGYGDGTYGPNDPLTRDQWLKMLLVALGKDPVKEGLIGDNWETHAAVLAMKTFITPEEYELPWNRETAVYYAFRALIGYEVNDETLAEKIYDMDAKIIYDDFGAPVSIKLTNGYPENSKYYKYYATIDQEPLKDWSNTVTTLKDFEDYFETKFDVYVDGVKATASSDCVTFDKGVPTKVGCNSADVKLYREPNGDYRVIVKNAYFDVPTKTEYTIGYYIDTVNGVKHEVGKIAPIPQTVTEKDTRVPASYVELDGEKELYACQAKGDDVKDLKVGVKYDVYYDSYGNVIYADDFHPYAPEAELVYVYDSIVTAEPVYSGVGFDKITGFEYTAQARVMHMDGTLETVDLAVAGAGMGTYIVNKYGYAGEGNKLDDGSLTLNEYFDGDLRIDNKGVDHHTSQKIYKVEDANNSSEMGYGNFYNMYTFDDGTVTLEGENDNNGEVAGPLANDVDSLSTEKGKRQVTGISASASEGPFANGSTKIHVITIDPAGPAIVEDGEVTLDAKGIANFDTADYVDGYYVLNKVGTVATDIYAIALKNHTTYTYGYYLGTTVETIEDGLNYKFGLSDGTTVEYTASVGNDAESVDDNNIGGLTEGHVYKIELTKGKLTDKTELIAQENDKGYGVEDDGYFVLQKEPNTQRDVAPFFGGYAWGTKGAKLPATYENADKPDYLELYYDNGPLVVFATVKYDADEVITVDTTYQTTDWARFDVTGAPIDPQDTNQDGTPTVCGNGTHIRIPENPDVTANGEAITLADQYVGKDFKVTLNKHTAADGTVTYTFIKAETPEKIEVIKTSFIFWKWNDNNTELTLITNDGDKDHQGNNTTWTVNNDATWNGTDNLLTAGASLAEWDEIVITTVNGEVADVSPAPAATPAP